MAFDGWLAGVYQDPSRYAARVAEAVSSTTSAKMKSSSGGPPPATTPRPVRTELLGADSSRTKCSLTSAVDNPHTTPKTSVSTQCKQMVHLYQYRKTQSFPCADDSTSSHQEGRAVVVGS
eukprot:COSAG05_NODE_1027_length_6117_cov_7.351778_7_plen_120_part_00